ncbi:MAG: o-succinylbenzoate synthase [Dermatophilaceae bacterium]
MTPPAPARPTPAADVPQLAEVLAGARVVRVPLRVPFRGVRVREVALLQGPVGWGEFGPFLEYGPAEAARWLAAAVEAGWHGWPQPVRPEVAVNATVPAVRPGQVASVLSRFDGCDTVKVKVAEAGQSLADDLSRVAAVRDVAGPGARIRVDANGGWGVADALDALRALAAYGLEYAEQPAATVADLRAVRRGLARAGVDVPIAADESIRKAEDPVLVAREEAADLVVVKAAPLGGVRRALQVVAECGLPAVVSSALDTSVGMAAGVALAAALPQLPYACGLGTVELLAADVAADPLVPDAGTVRPRAIVPDQRLLARWRAPSDRESWWRRRIADCYAVRWG